MSILDGELTPSREESARAVYDSIVAVRGSIVSIAVAVLVVILVASFYTLRRIRDGPRLAEDALKLRERSLAKAQRIARLGNWTWNAADQKLEWSDKMYRLLSLSPGAVEPSTATFMSFVHPDDADVVPMANRSNLDHTKTYSAEYRITRADGLMRVIHSNVEVEVDAHGQPVSMDGVDHDVTGRKRAEMAVPGSEARLRSFIDHSPSAISLKGKEGQITLINRNYGQLLGIPKAGVIGNTLADLFPPQFTTVATKGDKAVLESGDVVTLDATLPIDGLDHTMMVTKFPVRDGASNISGIGTISTDITDHKQAEQALRNSETRLAMAQRMARLAH